MNLTTAQNAGFETQPSSEKQTILVVDDEEVVRSFVRRVLERCGYEVLEAADGPIGAAILRSDRSRISAVVLDYSMPGMSGAEVFKALRLSDPDMPVVFTTGYDVGEALGSLADSESTRCIQKPFSPSLLTEILHDMLEPEPLLGELA
jgi:CheY-like chemotaxis protein